MSGLFDAVDALIAKRSVLPPPVERERLRKAHGLTRSELADALQVRRATVVFWRAGRATSPRTEGRPEGRRPECRREGRRAEAGRVRPGGRRPRSPTDRSRCWTARPTRTAWADWLPPPELARVLGDYATRVITPCGTTAVSGLELMTALRPPIRAVKDATTGAWVPGPVPGSLTTAVDPAPPGAPDEHPVVAALYPRSHRHTPVGASLGELSIAAGERADLCLATVLRMSSQSGCIGSPA